MKYLFVLVTMILCGQDLIGQSFPNSKKALDSLYALNIQKSKINNVYIPRDLEDAHKRLTKLTPVDAILKFKNGQEKDVCMKLHFGIGKWMIVNWNFYEGSRLSHYLKQKGVLHPDDMAQFILRTYHRSLNNQMINEEEITRELAVLRKKEAEYLINN